MCFNSISIEYSDFSKNRRIPERAWYDATYTEDDLNYHSLAAKQARFIKARRIVRDNARLKSVFFDSQTFTPTKLS